MCAGILQSAADLDAGSLCTSLRPRQLQVHWDVSCAWLMGKPFGVNVVGVLLRVKVAGRYKVVEVNQRRRALQQ